MLHGGNNCLDAPGHCLGAPRNCHILIYFFPYRGALNTDKTTLLSQEQTALCCSHLVIFPLFWKSYSSTLQTNQNNPFWTKTETIVCGLCILWVHESARTAVLFFGSFMRLVMYRRSRLRASFHLISFHSQVKTLELHYKISNTKGKRYV